MTTQPIARVVRRLVVVSGPSSSGQPTLARAAAGTAAGRDQVFDTTGTSGGPILTDDVLALPQRP
jgi:hypothetical protein